MSEGAQTTRRTGLGSPPRLRGPSNQTHQYKLTKFNRHGAQKKNFRTTENFEHKKTDQEKKTLVSKEGQARRR